MDKVERWTIIVMLALLTGCMLAVSYKMIVWHVDAKMSRLYCGAVYYGIKPTSPSEGANQKGGE